MHAESLADAFTCEQFLLPLVVRMSFAFGIREAAQSFCQYLSPLLRRNQREQAAAPPPMSLL